MEVLRLSLPRSFRLGVQEQVFNWSSIANVLLPIQYTQ